MPRYARRGNSADLDLDAVALPVGFLILLVFLAVLSFLKTILLLLGATAGLMLFGFAGRWAVRAWWRRQLNLDAYIQPIDWPKPSLPRFDDNWMKIEYPNFPERSRQCPPHVIGNSGAWKDVEERIRSYPVLCGVTGPEELQRRVVACASARSETLMKTSTAAATLAVERRPVLEQHLKQLKTAEADVKALVVPQLQQFEGWITALLESPGLMNWFRARRLRGHLDLLWTRLNEQCKQIREHAEREKNLIDSFLDPVRRDRQLTKLLDSELEVMEAMVNSAEFAGAAAEVGLIENLITLPRSTLVFNDVTFQLPRYTQFRGKPLISAQVDTLVISPAGVFVIEVKNWSRAFADSGQGFNPYEQASRASRVVYCLLRDAGRQTKVRTIIASNGHLPPKRQEMVKVLHLSRVRGYIEWFKPNGVDVNSVRTALRL